MTQQSRRHPIQIEGESRGKLSKITGKSRGNRESLWPRDDHHHEHKSPTSSRDSFSSNESAGVVDGFATSDSGCQDMILRSCGQIQRLATKTKVKLGEIGGSQQRSLVEDREDLMRGKKAVTLSENKDQRERS
ncbi:hypothetical protein TIFTF001_030580 [Ficus carica]|uniref:Uncharacterized protein n=1 Tax=Ficus carica TaxID=3494 RepID=A0AA88DTX9_FICCA|nr:hypothetical protein TIFTF001_030580 [Ficus carica]